MSDDTIHRVKTTNLHPEPCALRIFRHQYDILYAPQSVSRVFLETDWGAIFQCKFSSAHGSGGRILSLFPLHAGEHPGAPRTIAGKSNTDRTENDRELCGTDGDPIFPILNLREPPLASQGAPPCVSGKRSTCTMYESSIRKQVSLSAFERCLGDA